MADSFWDYATHLFEIIWLNALLSGDNAVVIGLAAAGLPERQRVRAVMFGVVAAAVLRIAFSLLASRLLDVWWIDVLGGLALLYIAWSFWSELRAESAEAPEEHAAHPKTLLVALWQIILADVSMSLDNVLAVAAVARDNQVLLIAGLAISVVLMGAMGGLLAQLLNRFRWIAYAGVVLIAWIALQLVYSGMRSSGLLA